LTVGSLARLWGRILMVDIILNREEIMEAVEIAHGRDAPKVAAGIKPSFGPGISNYDGHITGALAELAAAKYYGVEVDNKFYGESGDGHQPDITFNGWGIEIKSTQYDPPILKFNQLLDFNSDIALLCHVDRQQMKATAGEQITVNLAGVVSRNKFLNTCYRKSFGYGDRYCMAAASMANPSVLKERSK
jgi:hypothetical protein